MNTPNIWTEAQFPLDENHGIVEQPDTTFPVLVEWHDPAESPTQAVARLNSEAMNAHGEVARLREEVEVLRGTASAQLAILSRFKIERAEANEKWRAIVHERCGQTIGTMSDSPHSVGQLAARANEHVCTAEALVYHHPQGKVVAERAIRLLDGASGTDCNAEYLRALAEMVCAAVPLDGDLKDEVADFLWASASTFGDRPQF